MEARAVLLRLAELALLLAVFLLLGLLLLAAAVLMPPTAAPSKLFGWTLIAIGVALAIIGAASIVAG
jgi:hypothetical protein